MRTESVMNYARVAAASIILAALGTAATAQELPSFMAPIAGRTDSTPAQTATNNVLALNTGMFELYGDAAQVFKTNILSKHPVILGLFSGAGGRFILYRPGMAPLEAPSGARRLSTAEIDRPQHDGADPGRGSLSRQSRRPILARRRCSPIAAG